MPRRVLRAVHQAAAKGVGDPDRSTVDHILMTLEVSRLRHQSLATRPWL